MLQKRSLLKLTEHSELNTKITLKTWSIQAWRQDSMTGGGGGRNKFGGAREVYLRKFERGTRAWEIYSSVDQTNKVKTKKKSLQFKNFHKFWSSSKNSCDFSRILKCRTKKKEVFVPKVLWNPVWVHKNNENTGGKHQFRSLRPRLALQ